jgi:hypothetical protein
MCLDIRFTDDISLKLLGLIPLVSGAGILTVLFAGPDRSRSEAALLGGFVGLLGAIVTFAVYMWERRNLKFCDYLIQQVAALERDNQQVAALEKDNADITYCGHHLGRPVAPRFGCWRMGKTQAEGILYTSVIISWLALPGIAALIA